MEFMSAREAADKWGISQEEWQFCALNKELKMRLWSVICGLFLLPQKSPQMQGAHDITEPKKSSQTFFEMGRR